MNILAFDTCFDACSVCVAHDGRATSRANVLRRARALRDGPRRAAHADDRRGDGRGRRRPSTTSIASPSPSGPAPSPARASASRRRARWRSRPASTVVGASSLAVMADAAAARARAASPDEDLAVAVDARRGEVYVQLFAASALEPRSQPHAALHRGGCAASAARPAARRRLGRRGRRDAGCRRGPARRRRSLPDLLPDAAALARIAAHRAPRRQGPLAPLYLRAARRQAAGRQIDCEGSPMRSATPDSRSTRSNLSLLWASPERVPDIAALHARLFDPPWDAESIARLHRASRRGGVRRAGARARRRSRASSSVRSRPTRRRSCRSEWRPNGSAAASARQHGRGARPRGSARRGQAALPRGCRRQHRGASGSTRASALPSSASRKGYYARASGPPVDAVILSLAL